MLRSHRPEGHQAQTGQGHLLHGFQRLRQLLFRQPRQAFCLRASNDQHRLPGDRVPQLIAGVIEGMKVNGLSLPNDFHGNQPPPGRAIR